MPEDDEKKNVENPNSILKKKKLSSPASSAEGDQVEKKKTVTFKVGQAKFDADSKIEEIRAKANAEAIAIKNAVKELTEQLSDRNKIYYKRKNVKKGSVDSDIASEKSKGMWQLIYFIRTMSASGDEFSVGMKLTDSFWAKNGELGKIRKKIKKILDDRLASSKKELKAAVKNLNKIKKLPQQDPNTLDLATLNKIRADLLVRQMQYAKRITQGKNYLFRTDSGRSAQEKLEATNLMIDAVNQFIENKTSGDFCHNNRSWDRVSEKPGVKNGELQRVFNELGLLINAKEMQLRKNEMNEVKKEIEKQRMLGELRQNLKKIICGDLGANRSRHSLFALPHGIQMLLRSVKSSSDLISLHKLISQFPSNSSYAERLTRCLEKINIYAKQQGISLVQPEQPNIIIKNG